jgi:hypothetical protein
MTAPDHTIKSFKNFLREQGHPYILNRPGFAGGNFV